MAGFWRFVALATAVFWFGAASAETIDIGRNQHRYTIDVTLPGETRFENAGIDRKFSIGGVGGNLRLIQDHYDSCEQLTQERQQNQAKNGFGDIEAWEVEKGLCRITLVNKAKKLAVSSFYARLDICNCFAALHFTYPSSRGKDYARISAPVVASLLANNGGRVAAKPSSKASRTQQEKLPRIVCAEGEAPDLCWPLDPRTGKKLKSKTGADLFVRSDMDKVRDLYREIATAEAILRKRGFNRPARAALLSAFNTRWFTNSIRRYGDDAAVYNAATNLAMIDLTDSSLTTIAAVPWQDPLEILKQFGLYQPESHDVVTGKKIDRSSLESLARGVPSCYADGNPPRDCKPLRYHWWSGCWIQPSDRPKLAVDTQWWKVDGLGELPMLPSLAVSSPVDLSKAKRTDGDALAAAVLDTPKKRATKNAVNDNPARRPACEKLEMWEY